MDMSIIEGLISNECDKLKHMLLDKNRKYGNSALEPKRIFSKADPIEQLKVRIDDKLSRIVAGTLGEDEDVVLDLLGYLILLRVAWMKAGEGAVVKPTWESGNVHYEQGPLPLCQEWCAGVRCKLTQGHPGPCSY
jgi:hypothetical protein